MPVSDAELARCATGLAHLGKSHVGVPVSALVECSSWFRGRTATVDFTATALLGFPLVVVESTSADVRMPDGLTSREEDVVRCLAEGLSNAAIGKRLSISLATVKDHVHHCLVKTGCTSRTELVASLHPGQV